MIRSHAARMHSFRFTVVRRSSSMMPVFKVLRDTPGASSAMRNNSTVKATSSGPCCLGLTMYTRFVAPLPVPDIDGGVQFGPFRQQGAVSAAHARHHVFKRRPKSVGGHAGAGRNVANNNVIERRRDPQAVHLNTLRHGCSCALSVCCRCGIRTLRARSRPERSGSGVRPKRRGPVAMPDLTPFSRHTRPCRPLQRPRAAGAVSAGNCPVPPTPRFRIFS